MREQTGWLFTLLVVPFIVTIALLAALQPMSPAFAAAPISAMAHHGRPPEWRYGHSGFGNRAALGNQQGAFDTPPNAGDPQAAFGRPGAAFRHRPPFGRYGYPGPGGMAMRSDPGFTLDGWRLLAALAVGGGFAGLAWSVGNRQGSGVPTGTSWAGEQELTLLREEVDRLRSEQRQLRAAVDWQERLLSEVNRPAIPPESMS